MVQDEVLIESPGIKTSWDFSSRSALNSAIPEGAPIVSVTLLLAWPWILRLRFALYGLTAAMVLAFEAAGFLTSPLPLGLALIGLLALSNWLAGRLSKAQRERYSANLVCVLLALDTLGLTAVLGLAGGFINPLTALLLVPVMLSAIALPRQYAWGLVAVAGAEYASLFRYYFPLRLPSPHVYHGEILWHFGGMWIAFMVTAFLVTLFLGKLTDALRTRETEIIDLQCNISRRRQVTAIAALAAGAAHELNTPLGTIAVAAREIEKSCGNTDRDSHLRSDARLIRSEIDRCKKILNEISQRGGKRKGEAIRAIDPRLIVDSAITQLGAAAGSRVKVSVCEDVKPLALPTEAIRQAIVALVTNAMEASPESASIQLSLSSANGVLRVQVADSGRGIEPTVLNQVAQPFFTTKSAFGNHGMGLFLVAVLIDDLQGSMAIESKVGAGTTVTLEIPDIAAPVPARGQS